MIHERRKTNDERRVDGVLVIDKPAGPTSHDVVDIVKRLLRAKKVGHLGTLDPAATGVLPLAINGATKRAKDLAGKEKVYEFTLVLGAATDTDDDTGRVTAEGIVPDDPVACIRGLIPRFIGRVSQRPPAYSAIKVGGRRAYEVAREGIAPAIEPRDVSIGSIEITASCGHAVKIKLECESGTYVRSLARDLGEAIGCHGHAAGIRRLKSGRFTIDMAVSLDDLRRNPALGLSRIVSLYRY